MVIFEAVSYALGSKGYEQEIREGIDDFCRVDRCIVVLNDSATVSLNFVSNCRTDLDVQRINSSADATLTSSHQFREAVTGAQYPSSGRAGG